jgi:hypothetical protein
MHGLMHSAHFLEGEKIRFGGYIWDNYGIRALTDEKEQIYDFSIYFSDIPGSTPRHLEERLPGRLFSGEFILNYVKLDGNISLTEYNRMVKGRQNQFQESYLPILFRISGARLANPDYAYGVSARVNAKYHPYNVEISYSYVPLQK